MVLLSTPVNPRIWRLNNLYPNSVFQNIFDGAFEVVKFDATEFPAVQEELDA